MLSTEHAIQLVNTSSTETSSSPATQINVSSSEHSISLNGFTLFRDYTDKRKYYYLPKGDVRIADNGKKLNYFAYSDSSIGNTLEQKGGFLTLEVELGPNDEELQALRDELPKIVNKLNNEKKATGDSTASDDSDDEVIPDDEFILAPVQFKEGSVKLIVLGEDGSTENVQGQIKIVGAEKPSLFGRQNAVFSVRLNGIDADIMYQMLTNKSIPSDTTKQTTDENEDSSTKQHINSQIAVMYDLTYKGIQPAHFVKITIDFRAVEDFKEHHLSGNINFDYGTNDNANTGDNASTKKKDIKVFLEADADWMIRTLINNGTIIVEHIDYTGNNIGSPLSSDDPSAIKLVKQLMSEELFEMTPAPQATKSALSDVANAVSNVANAASNIAQANNKDTKNTENQKSETQKTETQKTETQKTETQKTEQIPEFSTVDTDKDKKISREEWTKNDKLKDKTADFDKYAVADYKKTTQLTKDQWKKEVTDPNIEWEKNAYIDEETYKKYKNNANTNKNQAQNNTDKKSDGKNSTVSSVGWDLGVKVGYSFKKRYLEEQVTRTYIFNKQTAVDYVIHPQGMLTVDNCSEFDVDKQVVLGRLGDGPFREHEITFSCTSLDFDDYHLKEILIDVNYVHSTGKVIRLTKDNTTEIIKFISEDYDIVSKIGKTLKEGETLSESDIDGKAEFEAGHMLSYKISFAFEPFTIKGFENNEDKVLIETEVKYASGHQFSISPEEIEGLYALKIQAGKLSLGENIKSVIVHLEKESDNSIIYNQILDSSTINTILLNPENNYKAKIQYNLKDKYDDTPVTKKDLTYTTNILTAQELTISDPSAGIIKITTNDGSSTFDTVSRIDISLNQDNRKKKITLRESVPEYYFVTDYTEGDPQEVKIDSVNVKYNGGKTTTVSLDDDNNKIYTDDTEYVLDISSEKDLPSTTQENNP